MTELTLSKHDTQLIYFITFFTFYLIIIVYFKVKQNNI
jgi:hypothetical protein